MFCVQENTMADYNCQEKEFYLLSILAVASMGGLTPKTEPGLTEAPLVGSGLPNSSFDRHAGPEEPAPYLIRGHPDIVSTKVGNCVKHWIPAFAPGLSPE